VVGTLAVALAMSLPFPNSPGSERLKLSGTATPLRYSDDRPP
jgi:hypothetical protein